MATELKYERITDKLGEVLDTDFTCDFRTGYVSVLDYVMPEYFRKFADQIQNMKIYEDDVWVCSFPKTGTTWTQEMVWCIANDLNFEAAKSIILSERFPFLDYTPLFDYTKIIPKHPGMDLPPYAVNSVKYSIELKRPRFIKTHLPWELLPHEIKNGTKKPKIIYVTRNPKDACVSYFHHCRLLEGYRGSFDDFCKLFLGDRLAYAPFWKNVLSYWDRRDKENVLFIRYEDMKTDLASVVRRVGAFLDKMLNDAQVDALVDHLSFESMKNNRAVNYESSVEINKKYGLLNADGHFMRSGQVGGYKATMTPEIIDKFDAWAKQRMPELKF